MLPLEIRNYYTVPITMNIKQKNIFKKWIFFLNHRLLGSLNL